MSDYIEPPDEARILATQLDHEMQKAGFERWELCGVADRSLVTELRAQLAQSAMSGAEHGAADQCRLLSALYREWARTKASEDDHLSGLYGTWLHNAEALDRAATLLDLESSKIGAEMPGVWRASIPELGATRITEMTRIKKYIGHLRLMRGVCPECNSDAPDIDTCPVCDGYRSAYSVYPPFAETKARWWRRFTQARCEHGVPMEAPCLKCAAG